MAEVQHRKAPSAAGPDVLPDGRHRPLDDSANFDIGVPLQHHGPRLMLFIPESFGNVFPRFPI
jgi:hypothetical protein